MITQPDKNISGDSKKWKNWVSVFLPNTCKPCEEKPVQFFLMKLSLMDGIPGANAILQE